MDFVASCRSVKNRLPVVNNRFVKEHLPKTYVTAQEDFREGFEKVYEKFGAVKDIVSNNKEVVVPLVASLGSYLITVQTGYPFSNFDKLMHYLWGYGISALGRKIAWKFNKGKFESLASMGMALVSGAAIELWESSPVTMSISNALSGAVYKKEFGLQTIDLADMEYNFLGSVTENVKEYAVRAKEGILRRFYRPEITTVKT